MKRPLVIALFLAFPICPWAAPLQIGDTLNDFTLADLNGSPVTLSDLSQDRALVIIFGSVVCPASLKYDIHRTQIHDQYAPKGVHLISVNANFNETDKDIKEHYAQNPVPFTILRGPHNYRAAPRGATHTRPAGLVDAQSRRRDKGRCD
ncbi:MAG: redoxin family protein, partial [Gemmatimonadetes bacterium]|nr:redoxin family protein [Gemmatimonadota bacterium]